MSPDERRRLRDARTQSMLATATGAVRTFLVGSTDPPPEVAAAITLIVQRHLLWP